MPIDKKTGTNLFNLIKHDGWNQYVIKQIHILLVDDDPINLEILQEYLEDLHYELVTAEDGEEALNILMSAPEKFDVILLDLMLPKMNGLELMEHLKKHQILRHVPVIMQTAAASEADLVRGLEAGVYYYLTKPFDKKVLIPLLQSAIKDRLNYLQLQRELNRMFEVRFMLQEGTFRFRTPDEGHSLTVFLAQMFPRVDQAIRGLSELFMNAIEHGNLQIGYLLKSKLNEDGVWYEEILRRLTLPEYQNKYVTVEFVRTAEYASITITDQGQGFYWEPYLELSAERAFDTHGRGIAWANKFSFDETVYYSPGNKVKAVMYYNHPADEPLHALNESPE